MNAKTKYATRRVRSTKAQVAVSDQRLQELHESTPPGTRLSCEEIADATGLSVSAVKNTSHTAINKFRAGVAELLEDFDNNQIQDALREFLLDE